MPEMVRNSKDRTVAKAQDFRPLEKATVLPVVMKAIFRAESEVTWRQL